MLLWNQSGLIASTAGSKLRKIEDPLTWVLYFLSYLAVAVSDSKAREMAAYVQFIIHIAQRHVGFTGPDLESLAVSLHPRELSLKFVENTIRMIAN